MKKLVFILLALALISMNFGCVGVYCRSGYSNMGDAYNDLEGFYWFDGHDNLGDCIEDWKKQGGEISLPLL